MPGKVGGNRKPKTYRDCIVCGERFLAKRRAQRACGMDCAHKSKRGKPSPFRGKARPTLRKVGERPCERCGLPFRPVKDTKRRQQRYCSRSCSAGAPGGSRLERAVREALTADGRAFAEQGTDGQLPRRLRARHARR